MAELAFECESCGAETLGTKDDYRCRGCGLHVCDACVLVFDHVENREHGTGDPGERIDFLRDALQAERERTEEWKRAALAQRDAGMSVAEDCVALHADLDSEREKCATAAQRLIEVGELHLADEQTIRNLKRKHTTTRNALRELVEAVEHCPACTSRFWDNEALTQARTLLEADDGDT